MQTDNSPKIGPANGSLVIDGGGLDPKAIQRFLHLSGGVNAPIVIVPTATGEDCYGPARQGDLFKPFTDQGATNLYLLHTRDRDEANSDAFVKRIREAQGLFFGGGRQWHLADAYQGTQVEKALWDLLDRGGCIGGCSAGATIQGPYMVRGDSKGNMIMMGDHEDGFGFLKNVAIDQHLLRRNRQFDLIEVVRPHSKSLSSVRFKVLRHGRTSLWLAGFGFQAAGAADEQVLSGHRRGLLHNTHICRCLEAYSSRGAFFSELQSGQIQAACSSSSRRRFFISMMRQKL